MVGPDDAVIVPDLEADEGFAFSISYRWKRWEVSLTYDQTDHDGDFALSTLSHETEIENLDLNLKRYYLVQTPLQPYALAGLGWSRATIENGSTDADLSFVNVGEGRLDDGVNVNLGAGIAFFPLPWVSVYAQGLYRFNEFLSSDGLAGGLNSEVNGDNWQVSVGASLRLIPGRRREK